MWATIAGCLFLSQKESSVWPTNFSCREEGYEMLYWTGWGLGLLPAGDLLQHKGWKEANTFLAENDNFANCFVSKILLVNSEIETHWNVYSYIHLSEKMFFQYYLHSIQWCSTKLGRCCFSVQKISCVLLEGDMTGLLEKLERWEVIWVRTVNWEVMASAGSD